MQQKEHYTIAGRFLTREILFLPPDHNPNIFSVNSLYIAVNGGYSKWSEWTPCSVTCGNGAQYRERKCENPHPANGGTDCTMLGQPTESKACFAGHCVPDGKNLSLFSYSVLN